MFDIQNETTMLGLISYLSICLFVFTVVGEHVTFPFFLDFTLCDHFIIF